MRKKLERFQEKKLSDYEFRILQGVFQRDFGHLEHKKKVDKKLERDKRSFKDAVL